MINVVNELISNGPMVISNFFTDFEIEYLKDELEKSKNKSNFSDFSIGFQNIINRIITTKIRLLFGKICSCRLEEPIYFSNPENDFVLSSEEIYHNCEKTKRIYTILIIINSEKGFDGDIVLINYKEKYKIDKGTILFKTFLRT